MKKNLTTHHETRDRLVKGAADLLSRRGLKATSIRETAKYAGAPLGSTYHFFPGGKQQLVTEALEYIGDKTAEALSVSLKAGTLEGVKAFLDIWKQIVLDSDFSAGCPVLSVSVEEPSTDEERELLKVATKVFDQWLKLITNSLVKEGVSRKKAKSLATLVVSSVEGTIALCRASRSIKPLEMVSAEIETVLKLAIAVESKD